MNHSRVYCLVTTPTAQSLSKDAAFLRLGYISQRNT